MVDGRCHCGRYFCTAPFVDPLISSWFCDFDSQVDALYSEGKPIVFHPIDGIKQMTYKMQFSDVSSEVNAL